MITFIKAKLKNSHDQTNIDKYRAAANITDYHIISKFVFLVRDMAIISCQMYVEMSKINNTHLKWTYGLYQESSYRV